MLVSESLHTELSSHERILLWVFPKRGRNTDSAVEVYRNRDYSDLLFLDQPMKSAVLHDGLWEEGVF